MEEGGQPLARLGRRLVAPRRAAQLAQRSRLGVEDEPAYVLAMGQLAAGAQAGEAVAQSRLDILEGPQPPRRQDAVGRERLGELILGGAVQAAALVHHHDDLACAEQPLRRAQRADRIVGRQPAGVADDVRVAALEAEHRKEVDARVHAGQHRDLAARARAQAGSGERRGARLRRCEHLIRVAHRLDPNRGAARVPAGPRAARRAGRRLERPGGAGAQDVSPDRDRRIVPAVSERRVATNGIELQLVDEGEGPLVILCHGFPELAFSWRHQVPALTAAGFRVLAPDLRGFGRSSAPAEVEDYDMVSLCGDLCGLLDAVQESDAIFVGHDWGANLVWQTAVLHPERVRAVAGLSVPFVPRAPAPPLAIMRRHLGEDFYIVWFQEPGAADAALARDVRRTLTTPRVWTAEWAADDEPARRPAWLSESELAVYLESFERTGFTAGLNWYRNIDRNWELTADVAERRVEQPALFLTGELDPVRRFMPAEAMRGWVTDLRAEIVVPGAGHWVQQQAPDAVNAALLAFLGELDSA